MLQQVDARRGLRGPQRVVQLSGQQREGSGRPVRCVSTATVFYCATDTTDFDPLFLVYLRAEPDVCFQRIKQRSRSEEAKVSYVSATPAHVCVMSLAMCLKRLFSSFQEYLQSLHKLHDDWLLDDNQTTPVIVSDSARNLASECAGVCVLQVVDVNGSWDDVIQQLEKKRTEILCGFS